MAGELVCSRSASPCSKGHSLRAPHFGTLPIFAFTVSPKTTKFGVATHTGRACFGGQPRHCILQHVSRGLSDIAEFLVTIAVYGALAEY